MPTRITLNLSDAAAARLAIHQGEHNVENKSALTLEEWIMLHLRELAIAKELGAAADTIRRQAQIDAGAALRAEKQHLLDAI